MRDPDGHPLLAVIIDLAMVPLARLRPGTVGQARGRVLELGVGTGLNLAHYDDDVHLHGIEPDPHMLRRAQARALALGRSAELLQVGAETLPFPDGHFDTVVATFVFCTIPDPVAAAAEALRVLRPGGRLVFAEHVASEQALVAAAQRLVDPAWQLVSGGCSLSRDPVALLQQAGVIELEVRRRGGAWSPAPIVTGTARKA